MLTFGRVGEIFNLYFQLFEQVGLLWFRVSRNQCQRGVDDYNILGHPLRVGRNR